MSARPVFLFAKSGHSNRDPFNAPAHAIDRCRSGLCSQGSGLKGK